MHVFTWEIRDIFIGMVTGAQHDGIKHVILGMPCGQIFGCDTPCARSLKIRTLFHMKNLKHQGFEKFKPY